MEDYRAKCQNFWYYHRIHVLIVVGVALFGGWLIFQQARTVEPDYHIGIVNAVQLPPETMDHLEAVLSAAASDRNGDGAVTVQLHTYWLRLGEDSPTAGDAYFQTVQALDADLVGHVSGIFLLEDADAFLSATGGMELIPGGKLEGLTLWLRADADEGYRALFAQLGE